MDMVDEGAVRPIECLNCGTELKFEPGQIEQTCWGCEVDVPMPVRLGADLPEHPIAVPQLDPSPTRAVLRCRQCRAAVSGPTQPTACPFCGVGTGPREDTGVLMAPDGVLRLRLSQGQARDKLGAELTRLKIGAQPLPLNAAYIPWWILSWDVRAAYDGKQGTEHQHRDGSGHYHTTVSWTKWSGVVERPWSDIQRYGSVGVPADTAPRLSPWDFAFVEPYEPAVVAEHLCEHTTVSPREIVAMQRVEVGDEIRDAVRHDIGGDRQIIDRLDVQVSNERYRLLLVPVWSGRLSDGTAVAINGRTGEVVLQGQAARQVTDDDVLDRPPKGPSLMLFKIAAGVAVGGMVLWMLWT